MTSIELMENLKDYIAAVVSEYTARKRTTDVYLCDDQINVYAGWPPVRTNAEEKESFIYCLALSWDDAEDGNFSTCKVEIGFSIRDDDKNGAGFALYNLMEHVRQALLRKRTLNGRNRLLLPMQSAVIGEQSFPQWQGTITVTYTLGQPQEEEIEHGDY